MEKMEFCLRVMILRVLVKKFDEFLNLDNNKKKSFSIKCKKIYKKI